VIAVTVRRKAIGSVLPKAEPSDSGVRARAFLRILVVETEPAVFRALEEGAREDAVRFVLARTVAEAELARTTEVFDLVACTFPIPGGEDFIRGLRRERFPVLVMTSSVQRAIDAFSLRVPVLPKPVVLEQLLAQAVEIGMGIDRPTLPPPQQVDGREPLRVVEVLPSPNPRDPRRE
jgi:CheY-like chemotaxis protein